MVGGLRVERRGDGVSRLVSGQPGGFSTRCEDRGRGCGVCWAKLLARMLDEVDSRKLDLARNFNLPRPRPGLAEVGKVASCSDEQIDVSVVDLIEDCS